MKSQSVRLVTSALLAMSLLVSVVFAAPPGGGGGGGTTVTVSGTPWGVSTCYIGATEGNVRFNVNDLTAAGVNTYRIYGGMSRWEVQDDDGVYGAPSIADIKANVNSINWNWWDQVMTAPAGGSDYHWSGESNLWQGTAAQMFADLKAAGIRPVLTIRNIDNNDNPAWAQALNPPDTQADWNEWWEHVFATVYWLNVRNDFQVDEYEVHNEPDNAGQGWGGTQADYFALVQQTKDAIDYVYKTYLPGRTYHIHATVTKGGSSWPLAALQQIPNDFDSVNIHNYNSDITNYTRQVHGWMNSTGHPDYPVWLSEWATYRGGYDGAGLGVKTVINNLIRGSSPGDDHIFGSHLFTFYDWDGFNGGFQNFEGLVDASGSRRSSFYAMQMAAQALNGCKTTYQSTSSNSSILAITTRDDAGQTYLLMTNSSAGSITVNANLSALLASGTGTMWQYDSTHHNTIVGNPSLGGGQVTVTIPKEAAVLLRF